MGPPPLALSAAITSASPPDGWRTGLARPGETSSHRTVCLYVTQSVILYAFPLRSLKNRLRNPRFSAGGFGSFRLSSS